jgi:hypothetical protein
MCVSYNYWYLVRVDLGAFNSRIGVLHGGQKSHLWCSLKPLPPHNIIQVDDLNEFASSKDLYDNFDCDINNGSYDFISGSLGLICTSTVEHIPHENNEDRVVFSLCTLFLYCTVIIFIVC